MTTKFYNLNLNYQFTVINSLTNNDIVGIRAKHFSTTSLVAVPDNDKDKLINDAIKEAVDYHYGNNVPKFKEPLLNELDQFSPCNSSNEAINKYGVFLSKHSTQASNRAHEECDKCIDTVTKQIKDEYPSVSDQDIKNKVSEVSEFKFYSEALRDFVLPGQEAWNDKILDQGEQAVNKAKENEIKANSAEGTDDVSYTSSEFMNQSVVENSKPSENNKRKYSSDEEVAESSSKPPKIFKQDSSDVTGDTEPFDIGGGDD
jgi:hypothetical protein